VFIFSFIGPVFYTLDPAENIFEEDVANFYMYKINQAIKQDPGLKEYLGTMLTDFEQTLARANDLKAKAAAGTIRL